MGTFTWSDVEKGCMQKIKDYQDRLQCQQEELKHLRDKLCITETHILNTTQKKLKDHALTIKTGMLEAVIDGLDMSENVNKVIDVIYFAITNLIIASS